MKTVDEILAEIDSLFEKKNKRLSKEITPQKQDDLIVQLVLLKELKSFILSPGEECEHAWVWIHATDECRKCGARK